MSGVTRPWQTEQERRADGGQAEVVRRGVMAVFVLTQPVMWLSWVVLRAVLSRQRWVRPIVYLPTTLLVLVGVFVMGGLRSYLLPARELFDVLGGMLGEFSLATGSAPALLPALGELAAARWPTWLAQLAPFGVSAGAAIAAVSAAVRYRRRATWREEDADAFSVPIQERRELRRQVRKLREPKAVSAPAGRKSLPAFYAAQVRLGLDMHTRKPFHLTTRELAYHAYVDGPSGFGKTTTLVRIAKGLVVDLDAYRVGWLMINMKPDPDVTNALRAIAKQGGRRFWHITHDGNDGDTYNPLRHGTAHEVASAVMKAEEFSQGGGFTEPHYRKTAKRYLNIVAGAMIELNEKFPDRWARDYPTLAGLMPPAKLQAASTQLSPRLGNLVSAYLRELREDKDLAKDSGGLRQRVAGAAESAAEPVLTDMGDGLVLEDAILAGDVVLFDLDAAADAEAAQLVGNLAITDVQRTLARLARQRWNRDGETVTRFQPIVVDEFSALGGTLLRDLFARARTHGGMVILSTQEAGSLDAADPTFKESVLTNSNVKVLHNQEVNAALFADLMGTEASWQETRQIFEDADLLAANEVYASGQGNLKQVDRYVVNPNVLRRLAVGEALVRVKSRTELRPALVAIQPWRPGDSETDDATPPLLLVDTYVSTEADEEGGHPAGVSEPAATVWGTRPTPEDEDTDDYPDVNTAGLWD